MPNFAIYAPPCCREVSAAAQPESCVLRRLLAAAGQDVEQLRPDMMAMERPGALARRHDRHGAAQRRQAEERAGAADPGLEALAVARLLQRHVGEVDDAAGHLTPRAAGGW